MMKRRFIPVGQGAFYHEQFDINGRIINVVYDCGSSTSGFDIEQEIKNRFQKGEEISIVFISHLHTDHVNGLEYLLHHCRVKNIVFPLTYPEDKTFMEIERLCLPPNSPMDEHVYRFIENPVGFIRERYPRTSVYTVIYGDEGSNNLNSNSRYLGETDYEHILLSGENVLFRIRQDDIRDENISAIYRLWEYVPFNFRNDIKRKKFYKILSSKMCHTVDDTNISQYLFQWDVKDIRVKIKSAYKAVDSDLNINTMTLFSGTKDIDIRQRIRPSLNCFYTCKHFLCQNKDSGCLYLGDYNAKVKDNWKALRKRYAEYWDHIGCVQIPHHGSSGSYNHELVLMDAFHIISAGKSNRYRHPHRAVLMDFLREHKFPYIVTEEKDTEIVLEIDI